MVSCRGAIWRKRGKLIVFRQHEARQDASEGIVDVVGWLHGLISGREARKPLLEGYLRVVPWLLLGGNAHHGGKTPIKLAERGKNIDFGEKSANNSPDSRNTRALAR